MPACTRLPRSIFHSLSRRCRLVRQCCNCVWRDAVRLLLHPFSVLSFILLSVIRQKGACCCPTCSCHADAIQARQEEQTGDGKTGGSGRGPSSRKWCVDTGTPRCWWPGELLLLLPCCTRLSAFTFISWLLTVWVGTDGMETINEHDIQYMQQNKLKHLSLHFLGEYSVLISKGYELKLVLDEAKEPVAAFP